MNKTNKTLLIFALVLLVAFGIYALFTRPKLDQEAPLYVQDLPAQQAEEVNAAVGVGNKEEAKDVDNTTPKNDEVAVGGSSSGTVKPCRAADVEGSASLQGAGASVIGTVIVSARSGVACSVVGNPYVLISDNNGVLSIQQNNVGSNSEIVLRSGEKVVFRTTWSNWCGRKTSVLSYRVTLPGDNGYLLVPAVSTNGQAQTMVPLCTNIQGPSVVSVTTFSR